MVPWLWLGQTVFQWTFSVESRQTWGRFGVRVRLHKGKCYDLHFRARGQPVTSGHPLPRTSHPYLFLPVPFTATGALLCLSPAASTAGLFLSLFPQSHSLLVGSFPSTVSLFPQFGVSETCLPVLQWPCAHPSLWSSASWRRPLPGILACGSGDKTKRDSVQEPAKVSQGGHISHAEAGGAMRLNQD